jgi:hypothetical protein
VRSIGVMTFVNGLACAIVGPPAVLAAGQGVGLAIAAFWGGSILAVLGWGLRHSERRMPPPT